MRASDQKAHRSYRLCEGVVVLLICSGLGLAGDKKAAPAAPAAKAAAPAAKPGAAAGAHLPGAAGAHTAAPGARPGYTTSGARPGVTTAGGARPTYTTGGVHNAPHVQQQPMRTMNGHPVPHDAQLVHARNGADVRMRGGHPAEVHVPGRMDIHHDLRGERHFDAERADHSRIYADRRGGFVQHRYMYGGHEYGRRTYYYNGRSYDRFYARYPYRGTYLNIYRPVAYYRPQFYGWAYNPWGSSVNFVWGASPAVAYYGAFYQPAPSYPSASLWLTDYMVSNSLTEEYQSSVTAQAPLPPQPVAGSGMTPEVKQEIANEVQRQILVENDEVSHAVPTGGDAPAPGVERMLTDNVPHVFVAGAELDVVDSTGSECSITEGDALQLSGPPAQDAVAADLVVLASKGGEECHTGVTVSVAIGDLQEMQNHMRAMIDQGMGELQAKQGTNGLPAIPADANAPPVNASFVSTAPPPDANVAKEIQQERQEGDQLEAQTLQGVAPTDAAAPADAAPQNTAPPVQANNNPPTLTPGQSIEEVLAIEGTPKTIFNAGAKKIYKFSDGVTVTFMNGKSVSFE